jgi:hypothetical protein
MKNKQQMEQWVEEAMNSFDGASRATANPFLFTRIQERLRQQNSPWEKVANQEKAEKLAREKQRNEQMFASEYTTSSNLSNELNPNR